MASSGHIDAALAHLGEVAETYEAQHPEISDPLIAVAAVLLEMGEAVKAIRKTF